MRKIFTLLFVLMASISLMATEGALSGKFTINADGDQIVFSQGNLQYKATTNTWRFAENQWDTIGGANWNIAADYDGWIDLFGWGTSGYDNTANDPFAVNYQPWSNSTAELNLTLTVNDTEYQSNNVNMYGYGPSSFMEDGNLSGSSANYDWGVYNAISNGGNQAGLWRTLNMDEWKYILRSRSSADDLRSQATVCGVHGYVLLPDNFNLPDGLSWSAQTKNWDTNTYDSQAWSAMAAAGAVFLPAAGCRTTSIKGVGSSGGYWSASWGTKQYALSWGFWDDHGGNQMYITNRYMGYSIRLVQTAPADPEAIENTSISTQAVKHIVNGQLLIEKNGVRYNALGQEAK